MNKVIPASVVSVTIANMMVTNEKHILILSLFAGCASAISRHCTSRNK